MTTPDPDPLLGASFGPGLAPATPAVRGVADDFCPVCGVETKGSRCRACDPTTRYDRVSAKAEKRAEALAKERAERLAMLRRVRHNPLLWLLVAVSIMVEPMFAVVFAVVGSWLALWVWVAGVGEEAPPGSPERQRAAAVAIVASVAGVAALVVVLVLVGQATIRHHS